MFSLHQQMFLTVSAGFCELRWLQALKWDMTSISEAARQKKGLCLVWVQGNKVLFLCVNGYSLILVSCFRTSWSDVCGLICSLHRAPQKRQCCTWVFTSASLCVYIFAARFGECFCVSKGSSTVWWKQREFRLVGTSGPSTQMHPFKLGTQGLGQVCSQSLQR